MQAIAAANTDWTTAIGPAKFAAGDAAPEMVIVVLLRNIACVSIAVMTPGSAAAGSVNHAQMTCPRRLRGEPRSVRIPSTSRNTASTSPIPPSTNITVIVLRSKLNTNGVVTTLVVAGVVA